MPIRTVESYPPDTPSARACGWRGRAARRTLARASRRAGGAHVTCVRGAHGRTARARVRSGGARALTHASAARADGQDELDALDEKVSAATRFRFGPLERRRLGARSRQRRQCAHFLVLVARPQLCPAAGATGLRAFHCRRRPLPVVCLRLCVAPPEPIHRLSLQGNSETR